MSQRVVVFIDAQNMYNGARRAFFDNRRDPHFYGQFHPRLIGELLAKRGRPNSYRQLEQVRIYSGRPDSTKDPKSYAAHMRQCYGWEAAGVQVITRSLRYPRSWPQERPQEKGIDVALVIDFVSMAVDDQYDVGILASADTDLAPAIEYVAHKREMAKTVEVAAWRSEQFRSRLRVGGMNLWCHWLDFDDYQNIQDMTDYNVAP